jgi:hypothetical protein
MAIIMAFELATYGLVASLMTRNFKLPLSVSLVTSMLIGRVVAGISVSLLVQLFSIKMNPIIFLKTAIVTGIPGMLIQLILVPAIVYAVRKSFG